MPLSQVVCFVQLWEEPGLQRQITLAESHAGWLASGKPSLIPSYGPSRGQVDYRLLSLFHNLHEDMIPAVLVLIVLVFV